MKTFQWNTHFYKLLKDGSYLHVNTDPKNPCINQVPAQSVKYDAIKHLITAVDEGTFYKAFDMIGNELENLTQE